LVQVDPASGQPFDHGLFELLLEDGPAPLDTEAHVCGVPLEKVISLRPESGGHETIKSLRKHLRVIKPT